MKILKHCVCGQRPYFYEPPDDMLNRIQVRCDNCLLAGQASATYDGAGVAWAKLILSLQYADRHLYRTVGDAKKKSGH